jgi:hypothetical protein
MARDIRELEDTSSREKRLQTRENRLLQQWLKSHETYISPKALTKIWAEHRDSLIFPMIKIAVQNFAKVEAVQKVNEILISALGMKDASISEAEVTNLAIKTFRLEMLRLILLKSKFPVASKKDIFERAISKEFPMREAVASGKPDKSMINILKQMNQLSDNSGPLPKEYRDFLKGRNASNEIVAANKANYNKLKSE